MKRGLTMVLLTSVLPTPALAETELCSTKYCYEDCFDDPLTGAMTCVTKCITVWEPCYDEYLGIVDIWGDCGLTYPRRDIIAIRFPELNGMAAAGALAALDQLSIYRDVPLPSSQLSITDASLTRTGEPIPVNGGTLSFYSSNGSLLVGFGTRELDRDGNGDIEAKHGETGELVLHIPENARFRVTTYEDGGVDIVLDKLVGGDAFYTFMPENGDRDLVIPTEGRVALDMDVSLESSAFTIRAAGNFPAALER